MDEQLFRISDVSIILDMKPHVIRNWENELGIVTPRSDCGHRYYTQDNIDMFLAVKSLKNHGFSLKQIRLLLPNIDSLKDADDDTLNILKNRLNSCQLAESISEPQTTEVTTSPTISLHTTTQLPHNINEIAEFRETIKDIITDAISENIDAITKEIGKNVSELVSKELNYQLIQHENILNDRLRAFEAKINKNTSKNKFDYFGLRSKLANLVNSDCHLS